MIRVLALLLCLAMPAPARSCETALLLAMDVSGSIDHAEYLIQVEGLAAALSDGAVIDALVAGQDRLAVVQWSGAGQAVVSLDWAEMTTAQDVARFAARVRAMPRAFQKSETAVGDAIAFAASRFAALTGCRRHVADISGDGPVNAGGPVAPARSQAMRQGLVLNALAIESLGLTVTNFYARHVVTRNGFVITARGHLDYARAIRAKLLRELTKPTG